MLWNDLHTSQHLLVFSSQCADQIRWKFYLHLTWKHDISCSKLPTIICFRWRRFVMCVQILLGCSVIPTCFTFVIVTGTLWSDRQIRMKWNPTVAQAKRRNIRGKRRASNPVLVELQWLTLSSRCFKMKQEFELMHASEKRFSYQELF